jgi:glycine cleavage system aminomethyltransferase T
MSCSTDPPGAVGVMVGASTSALSSTVSDRLTRGGAVAEPFDMSLVQRGARLRRSPYFEATQRYGPKGFTVYNHMLFPTRFDDYEAEYWHLLEHVTVWDVAVERNLEVSGPDGARLAQLLTCRDLSRVEPGQARYVLITSPDGGILNDPVMLRLDESTFWFALADSDVLLYALGLAASADLDVTLREPEAFPLQIQGPRAKEVVGDLFGDEVLDLGYYRFTRTEVRGIPVIVTRTGWSAEVGYELYLLDAERGVDLWEHVMEAGRPYGIRPTGPSDIRRIEAGILNWGADMDASNNPFEVGLDRLVDLEIEAPFMGKEALRRIRDEGVSRRLVGVEAQGMTACPCAQELVMERSQERLRDDGFTDDEIARVFEAVPVATHNQRGIGTLHIGCPEGCDEPFEAETLLEIVESAMSSEIYELMKRSDEVEVVEKAHLRPRFVEDCVREMIRMTIERFGHLDEHAFVSARQENLETIHKHNVVAERHGLLGELRREVDLGERVRHHVTKREWLEDAPSPERL